MTVRGAIISIWHCLNGNAEWVKKEGLALQNELKLDCGDVYIL